MVNAIIETCREDYSEDPFVKSAGFPLRVKAAFTVTADTFLNGLFKCVYVLSKPE